MSNPTYITVLPRLVRFTVLVVLIALAVGGCAKEAIKGAMPLDAAWQKANRLYERERYLQAQEVLRDITLNYSGSVLIDSAQFLLGRVTFELGDYLVAAEEFRRVVDQYSYSKLGGDAAYWIALCKYRAAPSYALDQESTRQALDGFQRFIEEYPAHPLADSALKYLGFCREKLARKEYSAAKLYHDLGEYASAVLYADVVLANYYDTSLADPALFIKGRSYYSLRDWSRAAQELKNYLERYPQGRHVGRAKQLLESALAKSGTTGAVSAAP